MFIITLLSDFVNRGGKKFCAEEEVARREVFYDSLQFEKQYFRIRRICPYGSRVWKVKKFFGKGVDKIEQMCYNFVS